MPEKEIYEIVTKIIADHLVLKDVKEYYEQAFNTLLWVLGGGLAVVGLVIPFLIQKYQNQKWETDETKLKTAIFKEFEDVTKPKIKKEILEDFNDNIKPEIIKELTEANEVIVKDAVRKLEIETKIHIGLINLDLGVASCENEDFRTGLKYYHTALGNIIEANDLFNFPIVIRNVYSLFGRGFDMEDFNSNYLSLGFDWYKLIKKIKEYYNEDSIKKVDVNILMNIESIKDFLEKNPKT